MTGENVAAVFPLLGCEVLRSKRERRRRELEEFTERPCGSDGGASGFSGCDFAGDDEDDTCADHGEVCECVDGSRPLRGSVMRRWCAFKATLTRGFGRDSGR